MAKDTARAMRAVWPPAQTSIKIDDTSPDPFLKMLLADLRQSGYALTPPTAPTGAEFRYLVDRPDAAHYRVSVMLDGRSLHRLYQSGSGPLRPASAWASQR